MSEKQIRTRDEIARAVAAALNIPVADVRENLAFGDVPEWDSLGHMNLLMTLEQVCGFTIDEQLIARLTSVGAIYEFVEESGTAWQTP